MLNETKIKCFLSLAKTLNFTATANTLFVSQQSVSKNISSLEEDLGFKLFMRTSHKVELTMEGERCCALFSQINAEMNAALSEIRYHSRSTTNSLSIGYQSFLDFGQAPGNALNALKSKVPDLKFDVYRCTPSLLIERLQNRQLNLILINGRFISRFEGLQQLELARTELVMMVSAEKAPEAKEYSLIDFKDEPFIVDSFEGESIEDYNRRVQQEVQEWNLSPSRIIWVPDRDTAYTYAEMGNGIVVGTNMSRIARNRNLKSILMGRDETLLAVWRTDEKNPYVAEYARFLQGEYSGAAKEGRTPICR